METLNIFAFADEASPQIDEQIATMKRNGLNGLEIRGVDGENISAISLEKAREVHGKLKAAGLTVFSIGSPIGKLDIETGDFTAHLKTLSHTLEVAQILEAQNLRMFSFFIPKEKQPKEYKSQVMDRLNQMLLLAKGSGVALCHENEKGIYGDNASRCLEILRAFPEIKGVFDPANFIQCDQDTMEAWELLKPYTKYLHIKDALKDGNVVPAGKGIGQVKEILDSYRAQGGRNVTIEPHLTVFSGLQSLEQKGEESKIGLYSYESSAAAFDAACHALKELL